MTCNLYGYLCLSHSWVCVPWYILYGYMCHVLFLFLITVSICVRVLTLMGSAPWYTCGGQRTLCGACSLSVFCGSCRHPRACFTAEPSRLSTRSFLRNIVYPNVVVHAFNPSIQVDVCEFEYILIYVVSSRIAKVM